MNVKKEMPIGSVTESAKELDGSPTRLSAFSADETRNPAYLK